MTQIANNYISQHKTRSRRSKNRWAYMSAAVAICGLLGVYGTSKASEEPPLSCEGILRFINLRLELYYDVMGSELTHSQKERRYDEHRSKAAEWATIYQAQCKE